MRERLHRTANLIFINFVCAGERCCVLNDVSLTRGSLYCLFDVHTCSPVSSRFSQQTRINEREDSSAKRSDSLWCLQTRIQKYNEAFQQLWRNHSLHLIINFTSLYSNTMYMYCVDRCVHDTIERKHRSICGFTLLRRSVSWEDDPFWITY